MRKKMQTVVVTRVIIPLMKSENFFAPKNITIIYVILVSQKKVSVGKKLEFDKGDVTTV